MRDMFDPLEGPVEGGGGGEEAKNRRGGKKSRVIQRRV
jgi:hypothetical protein